MTKGVYFVVDGRGRRQAVLIDLKRYGRIWEDFYDILLVEERKSEPRKSLKEVRRRVSGKP